MTAQELVKLFEKEYEVAFDDIIPLNRKTATTYMKRACTWVGNDPKVIEEMIPWLMCNWVQVCAELRLKGRPSISLFGSADLFHQIKVLKDDGFSKSVKSRFVKDESPSVGW